jgi:hypothetical protein
MDWTQAIYNFFSIIIMSIVFHEIGHLVYCYFIGKKAVLKYELLKDIDVETFDLTNKQFINVLLSGIVSGGVVILFGIFLASDLKGIILNVFAGIIYFVFGIKNDFKKLKELEKDGEKMCTLR